MKRIFNVTTCCLFFFADQCHSVTTDISAKSPEIKDEIEWVYNLFDPLEMSPEYSPPFYVNAGDWLIENRPGWSHQVNALGIRLDSFFATKDSLEKNNASYLKLGIETHYGKFGDFKLEPKVRFKLDLPTLREQTRLVIDSDPDDNKPLSERTRNQALLESERTSTTPTGQLQLLKEEFSHWETSTFVGAKLQIPLDPFWKIKTRRDWELHHQWLASFQESVYYYHLEGWGESSQVELQKPLSDKLVFRSFSEAEWHHSQRRMDFAQVWGLEREISRKRAIKYELGVLATTRPSSEITAYFIDSVYKRLIYKTWLYYEIVPELLFPREDNFKLNPSITLRLEMLLSNDR